MIHLLAMDLDGTLFGPDATVSERSFDALGACRDRGIRIAIATARPYLSLVHRLDPRLRAGVPWICSNGAMVYQDGECTYVDGMPEDTARKVLVRLTAHSDDLIVSMEMGGGLYIDRALDTGPIPFKVAVLPKIVCEPVTKILVTMADETRPHVTLPDLPDSCRVDLTDGGRCASLVSQTATKDCALARLLEDLGLEFDEVMAFGDEVTDIEMIRRSGVGVAMANAIPEVLAAADRVTASNEEDGVAVVLEELLSQRS